MSCHKLWLLFEIFNSYELNTTRSCFYTTSFLLRCSNITYFILNFPYHKEMKCESSTRGLTILNEFIVIPFITFKMCGHVFVSYPFQSIYILIRIFLFSYYRPSLNEKEKVHYWLIADFGLKIHKCCHFSLLTSPNDACHYLFVYLIIWIFTVFNLRNPCQRFYAFIKTTL